MEQIVCPAERVRVYGIRSDGKWKILWNNAPRTFVEKTIAMLRHNGGYAKLVVEPMPAASAEKRHSTRPLEGQPAVKS